MSADPSIPLSIDVPIELRSLVTDAAAKRGLSVAEFVVEAVAEKSQEVVFGGGTTTLSDVDRDLFLDLLDAADAPNPALLQAVARYRSRE